MPSSDRGLKLPALDPAADPDYRPGFCDLVTGRRRLGDAAGHGNFGVNFPPLPPGRGSSQRHWHTKPDEVVLIGNAGGVEDRRPSY